MELVSLIRFVSFVKLLNFMEVKLLSFVRLLDT